MAKKKAMTIAKRLALVEQCIKGEVTEPFAIATSLTVIPLMYAVKFSTLLAVATTIGWLENVVSE